MPALPAQPRASSNQASSSTARGADSRVEFIAVTQSDELLEQLGQSLDGESAIRHADTIEAARALIQAAQPCVVMLDAREYPRPGDAIDGLQPANGLSVVVVFAPADQTGQVAQEIKRSPTFAVLPVPLETAKTAAVLEGAREEALARRNVVAQPKESHAPLPPHYVGHATTGQPMSRHAAVLTPVSVPAHPETAQATRSGPPRTVLIGGIAALALVAIVVGAWVALRGDEDVAGAPTSATTDPNGGAAAPDELSAPAAKTPREAPTALPAETDAAPIATAAAQALVTGPIDELLDKARVAFRERRYTDPEKDNALLYYRSALAQEPDNGEALEGLARIGSLLDQRLQSAMATQDYDEATATLARLKLIKPGDAALKATEAKLAEARIAAALADDEVDRAAALVRQATQSGAVPPDRAARLRDDIERRQTDARAKRLAELVTARIREGRLVDPANDSAKFHVAQLRKVAPDSRRATSAARDLENAYLKRARDAGVARQTAEYERWVAEARDLGASQARIAAVQREVRAATTARPAAPDTDRNAKLVQERINAGKLLDPPGDSALFHLSALRATDAAGAATAAGVLSTRLLERSRSSISAGRLDDAERHAAAARQLGLNLPDVEAVEASLAAARVPAPPVPVEVTADQLRRTRYVAPEYPRQALDKEVGGEVRVKYTVGTDGRVKDVAVTASRPAGVFDEVALSAVRRWRFRPHEVDGQPVEAISGTIMIFKPGGDSEH